MGVYVKGMDMPTNCDKCRFLEVAKSRYLNRTYYDCMALNKSISDTTKVLDDCPLIEIDDFSIKICQAMIEDVREVERRYMRIKAVKIPKQFEEE